MDLGLIIFAILTVVLWWALQRQAAEYAAAGHGHQHGHGQAAGDDLTKIEGIGPKIAALLKADGIDGYSALGKAKQAQLEKILDKGGAKFNAAEPDSWPKQAKLAAKGDWEALTKLQEKLTGGR